MVITEKLFPYIKKILGALIVGIILFFLARYLITSWTQIPFDKFKLTAGWLAVSFLGLIFSFLLTIKVWQEIMASLGIVMSFRSSWWVITGSYLGKYIPGHVWAIGGRMWLCKKEGVQEKYSGTGMLLEMMLLLLSSLLIFSYWLFIMPGSDGLILSRGLLNWRLLMIIPIPVLVITLFTPLFRWALKSIAKFILKRKVSLNIEKKILFRALFIMVISSVIQGLAFYALVRSIFPLEAKVLLHLVAIYNGSWAIGFLSIIAPGGLGVREGAMALFLKQYLPTTVAIIIAAAARLWMTIFEIIMALIGIFLRKAR